METPNKTTETTQNFFQLANVERRERMARVKIFEYASFSFSVNLYRHLIDAFTNKIVVLKQALTHKESILFAHLAQTASNDARFGKDASQLMKTFDRSDVSTMIAALQCKIDACELNRNSEEFNAETMVDMKLALLELKTLTLAEMLD